LPFIKLPHIVTNKYNDYTCVIEHNNIDIKTKKENDEKKEINFIIKLNEHMFTLIGAGIGFIGCMNEYDLNGAFTIASPFMLIGGTLQGKIIGKLGGYHILGMTKILCK
jgi:hypothetical protein